MIEQLTEFTFHSRITDSRPVSIVFFSAISCGSCCHLEKVLDQLALGRADWDFYKIDAQQDMALCNDFDVFHLPSLFLFNQSQFHTELSCEANISSIQRSIEEALLLPPKEAP